MIGFSSYRLHAGPDQRKERLVESSMWVQIRWNQTSGKTERLFGNLRHGRFLPEIERGLILYYHCTLLYPLQCALHCKFYNKKTALGVIIHFWIKNKIVVCLWHHDHLGYLPKAKGKRGHGSDEVSAVIRGSLWFDNDYWRYDKTVLWGRWRLPFSRTSFAGWSVFHLKRKQYYIYSLIRLLWAGNKTL